MIKKLLKSFIYQLLAVSATLLLYREVFAKAEVIFVLDASGSMKEKISGKAKIDIAKQSLLETFSSIGQRAEVGLRVFAHRVEQSNKAESCKDTELLLPLKKHLVTEIKTALQKINPKGYTPIAWSLQQTPGDFSFEGEAERAIILLSDGEETCGGDPVSVVRELISSGFKVTVHTVGFDVDLKTQKLLMAIASAGGGKYYDAKDAIQLTSALKDAAKKTLVPEKEKTVYGTEIVGGNDFESAVALPPNMEFRLDHHLKRGDYDYFYVDLPESQELLLKIQTYEKGISINDRKEGRSNDNPYAGLKFLGPNRAELANIVVIGQKFGVKEKTVIISEAGRYYILIGNEYDSQNGEHTTFSYKLISRGDLGGEKDAGNDISSALPISAERYATNFLGGADDVDLFSFKAKKGDRFIAGFIPGESFETYINLAILDDFKQEIIGKSGSSGQGLKLDEFEIPTDGEYFLRIKLPGKDYKPFSYTFELRQTAGTSPAPVAIAAENIDFAAEEEVKKNGGDDSQVEKSGEKVASQSAADAKIEGENLVVEVATTPTAANAN
ncbi:MAG TPA: VWA domain-containing protein [Oligoflexia bacterium]|nr:VWA domain-containing protein [Oligoflexia bacterium]HMP26884.1 VWA domain-containing protein [Oligoflexia bacterium]